MNKEVVRIGSVVTSAIATEGLKGLKEISSKCTNNYSKRRQVGFEVIPSITGAVRETKQYYTDIFLGKTPTETVAAISFDQE